MIDQEIFSEQNTSVSKNNSCTVFDLMKLVLEDGKLTSKEKRTLIDELRKNNPTDSDRWTYRSAIWFLGGIVVVTVVAICILTMNMPQKLNTEGLIAIASAAVGGLAGLLNHSRNKEG